ncbi:protein artemis-like isoform X5 [Nymphalis io]|uniref:protein artemis-like isoform X1 n=2 Tax=Inachis io TaxID=171585 RepID=UPI0021680856|nr:protein artemis-like isoform X1 [Nymphalis io]XP_050360216.1 protein artemis-like isoform X4 [Nymphalis io]XP_050360217.1 protein artemis-like isoform X5 [Nymphalis io]
MMSSIPYLMKSPFHGKIEEIRGVYVDNFDIAERRDARAYFLSHYNSDHIQRLHSAQLLDVLLKKNITIYTTELTAAIINDDKHDERIMKCVRALKMGSTQISLPGLPEKDIPELCLTVTLIPASHSAASTMFLFSTTTHNILFIGEYHINRKDLPSFKHLHVDDKPIKLDAMYVDTTMQHLDCENFTKRSNGVQRMIFEIRCWLNWNENNAIAIHTSDKYDYEFVFNEIYKQLNMKVFVHSERWSFYSSIQELVPGVTNNEESTRIHLCRNRSEDSSHTSCVQKCHNNYLLVDVFPMPWQNYKDGKCSVSRVTQEQRLDVCFATHCTLREIDYFVDYFAPNRIIGYPHEYAGKLERNELCYYSRIGKKRVKIPKRVDDDLKKLMFG